MAEFIFELITEISGEIIDSKKVPKWIRVILLTLFHLGLIGLFMALAVSGFNKDNTFLAVFGIICTALFIFTFVYLLLKIYKK